MKNINKAISTVLVTSILLNPIGALAMTKTETVFENLTATGKVTKTTVNNHLTGLSKQDIIDNTTLKEILNINGDEDFNIDGNKLTWKSTGKDIFYKGYSKDSSPITVKATYYLNDKEVKVKDIVGKEGTIKVVYNFTNNAYNEKERLYTPFVVTMATMINNKNNSNITVENGKAVNTGTKSTIAAVAAPGLYNDLKINELQGLDKVTVSYDTTSFSQSDVYLVATPKVLEEADLDVFTKLDSISSSINTLQDNMNLIVDGANKLSTGSLELLNGSKQIKAAVDSSIATTKADTTNALTNEQVAGIKQQTVASAILNEQQLANIEALALQGVQQNATYQQLQGGIQQLEAAGINQGLVTVCTSTTIPEAYQTACATNATYIQQYSTYKQMIQIFEETAKSTARSVASQTATTTAGTVAETLASQVANQVKQAATTKTVESLNTLSENLGTLVNGVETLNTGATTLADGTKQLNELGINKLTNYANTFKGYSNKLEKLVNLSKNYKGFTSNNADETIFIYKMKSVK